MSNRINRRSFIHHSAKSIVAAGLGISDFNSRLNTNKDKNISRSGKKHNLEHRILGRTGLALSAVGYGAMRTTDPAIIHRAIDLGINYIDTAHAYMDGYSEVIVGKVLKRRRRDAYVATKVHIESVDKMMASLEASLKSLQTDYVDIIQLHGLNAVSQIQDEKALTTLRRMKEQGKARYIGFTTHRNQVELIRAAISMDFYDMILAAYNFKSPNELGEVIQQAAKVDIGIIAMKTQAGGYRKHEMGNLSPHQAALKWVLQNPSVTAAIPSMVTYGQLDENIGAMNSDMGWLDRKTLDRYSSAIDKDYCRMCEHCTSQCPNDVDVPDVNRSLMYAAGYGDFDLASKTYWAIPLSKRPDICEDCRRCRVRCLHGLNVREKMMAALHHFT